MRACDFGSAFFFGGIGGASRKGILVKGSNYLQMLSEVKTIVFDKTGTLTKGNFQVTNVLPVDMNSEQLLQLAASVEAYSMHPIALSIQKLRKTNKTFRCARCARSRRTWYES